MVASRRGDVGCRRRSARSNGILRCKRGYASSDVGVPLWPREGSCEFCYFSPQTLFDGSPPSVQEEFGQSANGPTQAILAALLSSLAQDSSQTGFSCGLGSQVPIIS